MPLHREDIQHQMWCDLQNGPVHVGEMRCDEDSLEIRTPTEMPCPFCAMPLVRFSGYHTRVIITALVGFPVRGRQLVNIDDIPEDVDILSCATCRRNFTAVAA